MKYSVVIPTYNHCDDFLKPCIESIIQYTDLDDIELIVSANGCKDNTRDYLLSIDKIIPHMKVIWSDVPLGYPRATNLGIQNASCDKIVLLNNDCKLLSQTKNQWLDLLIKPFSTNEKCGISCVVKEFSKVMRKEFAVFFCVMIDKKVIDKVGYLNEEYGSGSGEDMEFCVKAQEYGYEICEIFEKHPLDKKYFIGNFPIYHFGEGTVHDKELVPDWDSTFLRNSFRLAKKYNNEWSNMKIHNDKKIGVITPIHNNIDHIFHAINSVQSQTINNIVHYLYDDGSTDGLYEGIKELLSDKNICYIRNVQQEGQSNARNSLIKFAIDHGCEYIAFLDADDFWFADHLEKNIQLLQENDIVYSKPIFVDENSNVLNAVNIPDPDIFIGKQLYHNNFIWISSVVSKIDCFKNILFDSNLNSVEDWDMWIRLFEQNYKFIKNNTTTVRYLVKNENQASLGSSKMDLFKQKHEMLPKLKLHLACGHDYNDDHINVDLYAPEDARCDVRFDVMKLPYPDNSVDEIKAFHIIEHFHFFDVKSLLEEWFRVLKPGGRLYLETPDFLETCRSFVEGSPKMPIEEWRVLLYGHFFAHPWVPGQTHKFLFTESQLKTNLNWAGFKLVNRLPPASKYVMNHTVHLFLTVEAFK